MVGETSDGNRSFHGLETRVTKTCGHLSRMQHHCKRVEGVESSVCLGDLKYTPDRVYRYLIPASEANTYRLIILIRIVMNRNPHHVPVSHVLQSVFELVVYTGYEAF